MKRWLSLFLSVWMALSCGAAVFAFAAQAQGADGEGPFTGVRFQTSFEAGEEQSENLFLGGEGVYKLNGAVNEAPEEPEEPEEPAAGAEVDLATISATAHYSKHVVTNLFDNNTSTKYLVMSSSTATVSFALTASTVVTSYALTSANDHDPRDPKDWDFYGSTDGSSWVLLDSRRNEDFANRFQTNTYSFTNSVSYLWYKLDILSNNGIDAVGMNVVQLAELVINPPADEGDTETGFTVVKSSIAGTAGLSGEEKINLFDRKPETKLVVQSATMWVSFRIAEPETVTAYQMVSANDWPERDPKTWTVYGSEDGSNWTEIDHRSGESFSERYQSRLYRLDESVCYTWYKLEVTEKYGSNSYLQLSDFTLLTAAEVPEYEEGMDALEDAADAWTGAKSLKVSGVQLAKSGAWARTEIFDGLSVPVAENTVFSYMILPSEIDGEAYDFEYSSCRVMLDLHFTDGTTLSALGVRDSHGALMSPAGQAAGKCLVVGQWNTVTCSLFAAAGKTVDRIDAYFAKDSAENVSSFVAYFDDLTIGDTVSAAREHLSDYIDILRGTYNDVVSGGGCTPAVTTPNGFNAYTPVNVPGDSSACYDYRVNGGKHPLDSISVTHGACAGMQSYGTWQFMPNTTVNASTSMTSTKLGSSARKAVFSHENEIARAHYYSVTLDEGSAASGVQIEITPTDHAAVVRFTFPADAARVNVIFDSLWASGTLTFDSDGCSFRAVTEHTSGGSGRMWIVGSFDIGWTTAKTAKSKMGIAAFPAGTTVLTMKIATSFIGYDQARRNLELEIGDKDFDEVCAEAQSAWEELCGRFEIEGAREEELVNFYSSLYRMYTSPNLYSENEGTNDEPLWVYASPADGTKKSGILYTNSGYAQDAGAVWQGVELFTSERSGGLLDGVLRGYADAGLTAGDLCPGRTENEAGSLADLVFADAYIKGVDFDADGAWALMLQNALTADPDAGGRSGAQSAPYLGYVSNDAAGSFSQSISNLMSDYALYCAASARGEEDLAEYFRDRCAGYAQLYNKNAGFFMGRSAAGVFSAGASEFDPTMWNGPKDDYVASDGWNSAFPALYDGAGMAALYGGREALTAKLNALFDENPDSLPEEAQRGDRTSKEVRMGQYAHNSLSALPIIYTYAFSSEPFNIQRYVREALNHLYTGSEIGRGYIGKDEGGALSAWYVFSALGFYPCSPATGEYIIGSPLFDRVTVHLDNGRDLVIAANNNSGENIYIQSATVNGEAYNSIYLTHEQLTNGCTIDFEMGAQPSTFGASESARPSSLSDGGAQPGKDLTGGALIRNTAYAGQKATAETLIYTDLSSAGRLFDDSSATYVELSDGARIVLTGGKPSIVTCLTVTSGPQGSAPASLTLEASDNGSVWKELAQEQIAAREGREITLITVPSDLRGSYRSYRLTFTGDGSLSEIEFRGVKGETFENPFGPFIYGDVNTDLSVDVTDVTALLNYLALASDVAQQLCDAGVYNFVVIDLNNDASIDVSDVTRLLDHIAGHSASDDEGAPDPASGAFVPSDAYSSLDERVSVTWNYADLQGESIEGSVTVTVGSSAACGTYTVKYADDQGVLDGYAPLGTVRATSAGVSYTAFTASALNAPALGAKAVVVLNANGQIVACEEIPLSKRARGGTLYGSFAAISDVHVFESSVYGGSYDSINGDEDLVRAVAEINAVGVDFTAITGDLILSFMDDESQINAELIKSTGILCGLEAPCYVVKGNHDKKVDESVWKELNGCDLDYAFTCGGVRFIFLSLKTVPNVGSVDDAPYGEAKLDWLEGELTANADKPVLLFMHYPVSGQAGLTPGNTYGFSAGSAEEARLLSMLTAHGAVTTFNGHTHYDFASSSTYPNIGISRVGQLNTYFVHLPSVAYPRNASNTTVTEESEGYIVRLFENGLLLEGLDFVTGQFNPSAICYLDTRIACNALVSDTMQLGVGDYGVIETEKPYENAEFRSSDTDIATVDASGVVTAVSPGSATITCVIDGFTFRLTVRVLGSGSVMSGSGTADDPYILTTAEHFVYIQNEFREGNNLAGVYFAMGCDICLNDSANYRPATSAEEGTFAGYFDGRGHVLSATTAMSGENFAVPYFYHVTGTIVNTVFECTMGGCVKTSYVVARTMNGGKLVNCIVRGSVYASNVNTSIVCGTSSGATIANCFIDVTVSGTTPGSSESGITMKGSGSVVNILYVPNGCTAHFGETSVTGTGSVASTMNASLSASASAAGLSASALVSWQNDAQGNPELARG